MKKYFILIDDKRLGPFSIDELRNQDISKSTLVWQEGYEEWKLASDVNELNQLIFKLPPPPPKNKVFERSYKTAIEIKSISRLIAYSFGIGLFSFFIFSFFISEAFKYDHLTKEDIRLSGCCIQSIVDLSETRPYGSTRRNCSYGLCDNIDQEFKRFKIILDKRKKDKIQDSIYLSLFTFLISSITLILIRYLIRLIHWVRENSISNS
jgi:hypothetical protein